MKTVVFLLACCVAVTTQIEAETVAKIVAPSEDVPVPEATRTKLSAAANIRAFLSLPNGDSIAVYDTVRDKDGKAAFMDNTPHVALLRRGEVVLDTDSGARTGPVRFHGLAVIPVSPKSFVVALAFTLGVDGAETLFRLIGEEGETYESIATLEGGQAQLLFSTEQLGQLELWQSDGQASKNPDEQCVWCRKHYKVTKYSLSGSGLHRLSASTSKQPYLPESFAETPFKER